MQPTLFPKIFRQSIVWLLWIFLAMASASMFAATTARNTATIAPPAGVVDVSGGCDAAVPPNCLGKNTSTAEIGVWAATVGKSARPPSGSTVASGQIMLYAPTVTVTGAGDTTSPLEVVDTLGPGLTYRFLTNPGLFTVQDARSGVLRFTLPAGRSACSDAPSPTQRFAPVSRSSRLPTRARHEPGMLSPTP